MGLVIDLRCLQDSNYYERGIGSHARMLLRHAPAFTGLIDPALPPLPAEVAALAPNLSPHAYIPGAAIFLNPSPFTPNQTFLARLLTNPAILKTVCVHDFIPYDDQPNYLANNINRLDYFTAMAWLRRYDVFFPNSVPTQTRLHELYGRVKSIVTGIALPPWVFGITPQKPRHILMIGGDDARKNPETLAAAHAASPTLRLIPLVITGHVRPERAARLRALTSLDLPGRLATEAMRELYAQAFAVVTPSLAEGFSLPVLEACAAGVPSIASDIPAHRALLPEDFLFPAEDAHALAHLLEKAITQRESITAAQAQLWQGFSEAAVARKIFGALAPKPAMNCGAKPRIALLTPMPPEKSGIADYSAAMLPELRKLAEVEVFSGKAISPLPHADARYDAVLSIIGNSPLHQRIYDFALRWGSAVICHDARLLGLASSRGLAHAARLAAAELGRAVSEAEILRWAEDERTREACFLGELATTARPLIFHTQQSVDLVQNRFGITAKYLPFAMQRDFAPMDRLAARAALGIPPDTKLIVSFGFLTRGKAIPTALAAFAQLRARVPNARLIFVGEATSHTANFQAIAQDLGITDAVTLGTGFVPEQKYRQYLAAADAALQLREGPPGNISGTLQDCINAGLPSAASADLAENLTAPAYIKRVADMPDASEIVTALNGILTTRRETAAECTAYRNAHSMRAYTENLLRILHL